MSQPIEPVVTPSPAVDTSSPVSTVAPPSDSSAAAVPPTPEVQKPSLAPAASASLLSETPTVDAPAAAPAVEPAPAAEPAAPAPVEPAAPVAIPTYEFKVPEGIEAAPEQLAKLNELIGGFEIDAKVDHGKAQEFGQKALEFHVAELQRVASEIDQQGREAWNTMREDWRNTFKSDPEIGGNRQQTTLAACTRIIDQFGGNEAQRAELRTILSTTGAGDHPALIRLLANVGKALGEGRPIPAVTPRSPVVPSRKERRYHASNGAA